MTEAVSEAFRSVTTLFASDVIVKAFGRRGEAGDPEQIVYMADRLTEIYRDGISRSQAIRGCIADEVFDTWKDIVARQAMVLVEEIDEFVAALRSELQALIDHPPKDGEPRHVTVSFNVSAPNFDELVSELKRITRLFQSGAI